MLRQRVWKKSSRSEGGMKNNELGWDEAHGE